jgi:hypothetical protein
MRPLTLYIFIALIFSACSSSTFKREDNCSKKGLEILDTADESTEIVSKTVTEIEAQARTKNLRDLFTEQTPELQACYQSYLDQGRRAEYNVCAIAVIEEESLTYLDVADEKNGLPDDLKKCLEAKLKLINFKSIKSSQTIRTVQPINLYMHSRNY